MYRLFQGNYSPNPNASNPDNFSTTLNNAVRNFKAGSILNVRSGGTYNNLVECYYTSPLIGQFLPFK